MSFVLDSSVALSWCFPDENGPQARDLLQQASSQIILVPSLWHIETTNVLGLAFRKRRLNDAELETALRVLSLLAVHTDTLSPTPAALLILMQDYELTAYDALYLELAMRRQLPLATFDRSLAAAAKRAAVPLIVQPE